MRGEYATDPLRNTVDSYTGVVPWGKTPEGWWNFYGTREWEAGGFAWTGFDIAANRRRTAGPRLTHSSASWTCAASRRTTSITTRRGGAKSRRFTCPALGLFGREGIEIPVWVYSNLDEVELFLNGKTLGSQKVRNLGHLEWKVKYEPGVLEARASKDGKVLLTGKRETTGPPVFHPVDGRPDRDRRGRRRHRHPESGSPRPGRPAGAPPRTTGSDSRSPVPER